MEVSSLPTSWCRASRRRATAAPPLLLLWADRYSGKLRYFDNIYNDGVIKSLKDTFPEGKCDILLVDDIVREGRTFREALEYLRAGLPEATISLLPAFTRNPKYLSAVGEEHLIWKRPEFRDLPIDPNIIHSTKSTWLTLPYSK